MKLLNWHELVESSPTAFPHLLDLRPAATHAAGHPPAAASLPVPADATDDEIAVLLPSMFLPPRHEPLLVCGDSPALLRRVVGQLRRNGRPEVQGVLIADGDPEAFAWVKGLSDHVLWRPPAYLEEHLGLLPAPSAGPVLDLGCGSGRAAVWLAARGYDATGADRLEDALDLARRLADRHGVEVTWLRRDLERPAEVPPGPWSAALAFRFLDRGLLGRLPDLLAPHGVAMVRTFRWDPEDASLPRRRFCLEPGEVAGLFPGDRWEILHQEDDHDPDGRPATGVVARLRS